MKFTNTQNEIIKLIAEDKVYDLQSFIALKFNNSVIQHDIKTLQKRKKEDYDNGKDKIDDYINSFMGKTYKRSYPIFDSTGMGLENEDVKYTKEELSIAKGKLHDYNIDKNKFNQEVIINGTKFLINTIDKPVYIIKDKSLINDFLIVWEFLKEEGYIIETKRKINCEDATLFFKKEQIKKSSNVTTVIYEYKDIIMPKLLGVGYDTRYIYKKSDIDYADFKLTVNNDLYQICSEYFNKKIISLPKLDLFVKRNFKSIDEHAYKIQTILTLIAIFFSIFLSCVSIYISLKLDNNNSLFWNSTEKKQINIEKSINNKIDKIEEILNKDNK